MADIVTFAPLDLRIIEISAGGDNSLDIVEIYSEWKDWLLSDPLNQRYPSAFAPVGGEPKTATESLDMTYFLLNNWKIRPSEEDHLLVLNGNLYTEPAGESMIVPTLGDYTVLATIERSSIVTTIEGGCEPEPPLLKIKFKDSIGTVRTGIVSDIS
jgi:hypothetical protein